MAQMIDTFTIKANVDVAELQKFVDLAKELKSLGIKKKTLKYILKDIYMG